MPGLFKPPANDQPMFGHQHGRGKLTGPMILMFIHGPSINFGSFVYEKHEPDFDKLLLLLRVLAVSHFCGHTQVNNPDLDQFFIMLNPKSGSIQRFTRL